MGIENIAERILSGARNKTAEIESESERRATELLDEARNKAESIRLQIINSAKAQAEEEKKRILTHARLEARNAILADKQNMIDSVFTKVLEGILSLPDSRYWELVKRLLMESVETGNEEVVFSPKDKDRIGKEVIDSVNATLRTKERRGNLKLSEETRDIKGGFVLKEDGIEINSSLSSLLELLREQFEYTVLGMLS